MNDAFVVIDFETTGLSPAKGARATEIAAVKVVGGRVVDSYQSLIKTDVFVSAEIERLTGISNRMLSTAPPASVVMARLAGFLGAIPLVAHNAQFDAKFLDAEFSLARIRKTNIFACTMKIARHVYPDAPNYKLATLLEYADIPISGKLHRALADATATLKLWQQMERDYLLKNGLSHLGFEGMKQLESARRR